MAKSKKPAENPVEPEVDAPAATPDVPVNDGVIAPSDDIGSKKQPSDGVE